MPDAWIDKLRHGLQVAAFGLVVAAAQMVFEPDKPRGPTVAFSLAISLSVWGIIDFGRHLLPSSRETGWPTGLQGILLVAGAIGGGWFAGSRIGDLLSRTFGLYSPGSAVDPVRDLRNSVLITLLAGIAAIYYFYSRGKGLYLERRIAQARRHADEARLKLLESQLEPHMLFNTLANLRALIAADPPRAQAMLDHLIAYLRSTLAASRTTRHTLQAEFERLRDYLELMAIRMGPRLAYDLQLPPQLASRSVPTLLLQPIVENAIQHGLEPQLDGGQVRVEAREDGGALVLDVIDTGVGAAETVAGTGFGLQQVRERLATLHGGAAQLTVSRHLPHGTHVRIRLPLQ